VAEEGKGGEGDTPRLLVLSSLRRCMVRTILLDGSCLCDSLVFETRSLQAAASERAQWLRRQDWMGGTHCRFWIRIKERTILTRLRTGCAGETGRGVEVVSFNSASKSRIGSTVVGIRGPDQRRGCKISPYSSSRNLVLHKNQVTYRTKNWFQSLLLIQNHAFIQQIS
jgi:hypothetical protein